jgi:hypothetical protein
MYISFMINNAFHKVVLSAFNITLGIHIICNHIGGILITTAIRKLNFISFCIQHLVGIGSPPHGAIQLSLAPDYLPRSDIIPNGDPHMGSNILVICINIMFLLYFINVWHLGGRDFIIFISVISWSDKICVIRIILKVIFVHSRTNFIFNSNVKLITLLLFSWRLDFILGERSYW